jgi:putative tryptophan/tyrosine transport system substrate-binding protein
LADVGGAAAAWPLAARAQQARMRRVGVFMRLSESDPVTRGYLAAFAQGLAPLGWSQSRNLQLILRLSGGDDTSANAASADLVRQNAEVILSHGTETSRIMQQHTRTIPIVFTTVTDPVGSGLVESLARPGGNTTGFTNFEFSMAGKWLELLNEVAPAVKNIAIIFNLDNAAMPGQLRAIALAAPALGLQVTEAKVNDSGDIERAINTLAQTPNAGFVVLPENLVISNRDLIVDMAERHRLPAVYSDRFNIKSGGLLSYGAHTNDLYRRAAGYVVAILAGADPGDLPIEQPTKFELVINLKTAKALGLEVPLTLLARADEVIE